ncbi:hypothetical protein SDJN02_20062, partial [Cucurbita argyrosperma subsp. argyrosperma]
MCFVKRRRGRTGWHADWGHACKSCRVNRTLEWSAFDAQALCGPWWVLALGGLLARPLMGCSWRRTSDTSAPTQSEGWG